MTDGVPPPTVSPDAEPPATGAIAPDSFSRRARVLTIALPIVGLAVAYALAHVVRGPGHAHEMAAAAVASVLGLGTTAIFGAAVLGETAFVHLTTFDLTLVVVILNTALAVLFAGAYDLLERVPVLGERLARMRAHAGTVTRERPWIRRWATAGVALFVISPLPGSGVLGGTLVGRVVGLSRMRTFLSVMVANAIVCAVYALFADALEVWMRRSHMTTGQRIGVFGAAVLFAVVLVKWVLSVYAKSAPAPSTTPAGASSSPPDAAGPRSPHRAPRDDS